MWKDSIRNIVVIFQTTILRIVGFYVRDSALDLVTYVIQMYCKRGENWVNLWKNEESLPKMTMRIKKLFYPILISIDMLPTYL